MKKTSKSNPILQILQRQARRVEENHYLIRQNTTIFLSVKAAAEAQPSPKNLSDTRSAVTRSRGFTRVDDSATDEDRPDQRRLRELELVQMFRLALDPASTGLVASAPLRRLLTSVGSVLGPGELAVVDTFTDGDGMVNYHQLVRELVHN